MSGSIGRPDYGAAIADLTRRIDALERRLTPSSAGDGHTHNGTGGDSVVVSRTSNPAVASELRGTAVGDDAQATVANATAVGYGTRVSGQHGTAVGEQAQVTSDGGIAVGYGSYCANGGTAAINGSATALDAFAMGGAANHEGAFVFDAASTNTNQVNTGTKRLIAGCPASETDEGDLVVGQLSFWVDEATNELRVVVKYPNSTVKYGSVALS